MKLKIFIKTSRGTKLLGEVELLAGIEFSILRRLQQGVDFFVRIKDSQRNPLIFQARTNNKSEPITMETLSKYGVNVFGRHEDIHYLLKVGKF